MASQRAETAEPVEPDPQTTSTDLYEHPAVYAALRAPDPALLAGVRRLIAEHLLPCAPAADAASAVGEREVVLVRAMNGHSVRNGANGNGNGNGNGYGNGHGNGRLPGVIDGQVRFEFEPAPSRSGALPSIMDPACGPANWLEPFARAGHRVAGNDLSPHMVAGARRAVAAIARERGERPEEVGEVIWGDMRDLRFTTGPFDVAIEIAGTTGLLERPEDLLAHLTTVGEHLRPGGLFLVTVFFDRRAEHGVAGLPLPLLCHDTRLLPVHLDGRPQGTARARYELIGWEENPPAMRMRRTVLTRDVPGCPPQIVEEYALRIWPEHEVTSLIERTGLYEVLSMEGLPEESGPAQDPLGEQTLVLRRV